MGSDFVITYIVINITLSTYTLLRIFNQQLRSLRVQDNFNKLLTSHNLFNHIQNSLCVKLLIYVFKYNSTSRHFTDFYGFELNNRLSNHNNVKNHVRYDVVGGFHAASLLVCIEYFQCPILAFLEPSISTAVTNRTSRITAKYNNNMDKCQYHQKKVHYLDKTHVDKIYEFFTIPFNHEQSI